MGLFSKNPAEKKLEELTGGFGLSDEYKALLRSKGIKYSVGEHIKNQLKEEIKLKIVSEEGLETRLRYLINQHSNPEDALSSNVEDEAPAVSNPQAPLKRYEDEVKTLKTQYDAKETVVVNLIEKSFAPPQITYDKFMDSVKNCSKVFNSQVDSALSIINLATRETPRIDTELENKISNMKAIISQIDELTNELIINLSSDKRSDTDVENLFDDMKDLIDSVKKYD
jgi:prefoldin subunit 5